MCILPSHWHVTINRPCPSCQGSVRQKKNILMHNICSYITLVESLHSCMEEVSPLAWTRAACIWSDHSCIASPIQENKLSCIPQNNYWMIVSGFGNYSEQKKHYYVYSEVPNYIDNSLLWSRVQRTRGIHLINDVLLSNEKYHIQVKPVFIYSKEDCESASYGSYWTIVQVSQVFSQLLNFTNYCCTAPVQGTFFLSTFLLFVPVLTLPTYTLKQQNLLVKQLGEPECIYGLCPLCFYTNGDASRECLSSTRTA